MVDTYRQEVIATVERDGESFEALDPTVQRPFEPESDGLAVEVLRRENDGALVIVVRGAEFEETFDVVVKRQNSEVTGWCRCELWRRVQADDENFL